MTLYYVLSGPGFVFIRSSNVRLSFFPRSGRHELVLDRLLSVSIISSTTVSRL